MEHQVKSIRPFIGARDFKTSQDFYRDLGFKEITIAPNLSYFETEAIGFYLQEAYVKDWIDNTMVFLEVENTHGSYESLLALNLPAKYDGVKVTPIREMYWGKEFFVHDPSGVLWHFGEFTNRL